MKINKFFLISLVISIFIVVVITFHDQRKKNDNLPKENRSLINQINDGIVKKEKVILNDYRYYQYEPINYILQITIFTLELIVISFFCSYWRLNGELKKNNNFGGFYLINNPNFQKKNDFFQRFFQHVYRKYTQKGYTSFKNFFSEYDFRTYIGMSAITYSILCFCDLVIPSVFYAFFYLWKRKSLKYIFRRFYSDSDFNFYLTHIISMVFCFFLIPFSEFAFFLFSKRVVKKNVR